MKTLNILSSGLVLDLLTLHHFPAMAIDVSVDTLKKIKLVDGYILNEFPYGRPFYIVGKAATKERYPVDLIELKLYESDKRKNCEGEATKLIYNTFWKGTTSNFEILIPKRLQFATCYNMVINYYKKTSVSGKDFGAIVQTIIRNHVEKDNPFKGAIGDLTEEVQNSLKAAIVDSLSGFDSNAKYGLVKMGVGSVDPVRFSSIPDWVTNGSDPNGLIFNTATIIQLEKSVASEQEERTSQLTEFKKFTTNNKTEFKELVDSLNVFEVRTTGALVSSSEIGELKSFFDNPKVSATILSNKKKFDAIRGKLPQDGIAYKTIAKLFRYYRQITSFDNKIVAFNKDIASYQKEIDKKTNVLNSAYAIVEQNISSSSSSFTSETDLEKSRFSSPISLGGMLLNPQESTREFKGLAAIGLRYYFSPVDKGLLSNPYLDRNWPFNRMSAALTILLGGGSYNYRGQPLDNAFAGVKPVLTLGYDLDRFITIDFGVVAFQQDDLNPLRSGSNWRFAPVINLSLEFDVFNRVNSSFSKQNYKITE